MRLLLLCVWCVVGARGVSVAHEAPAVRALERAGKYSLEATLLLNEETKKDREVGYKIRGTLIVAPVWAAQHHDYLLKFNLVSPQLYLRGKHVNAEWLLHPSVWDKYADTTFYAHWQRGVIQTAYLDTSELPDVVNFKRGLISLFQFQVLDVELNETDVSGTCDVLYETLSTNVVRKIKRRCSWESEMSDFTSFRRITRVSLSEDAREVSSIYAEELAVVGEAGRGEGVKARVWTHLKLKHSQPAQYTQEGSMESLVGGSARAASLAHDPPHHQPIDKPEELSSLVSSTRATWAGQGAAGGGGRAGDAALTLRVLAALEHSTTDEVSAVLNDPDNQQALGMLLSSLGALGTAPAHAAAAGVLRLRTDALSSHAHAYLAAVARAPIAHDSVIEDILQLGVERRADAVGHAALLAAGGAAGGRRGRGEEEGGVGRLVRDRLLRLLGECEASDEECRCVTLQALGNMRSAGLTPTLVSHALPPASPRVALAALAGVGRSGGLKAAERFKLLQLAVMQKEAVAFEVRARALLLFITHAQHAAELGAATHAVHALHAAHATTYTHELRRVMWHAMNVTQLRHVMDPALTTWDQQAHAGTSLVTTRQLGWAWGGEEVLLHSAQLAARGVLRSGEVKLTAGGEPLLDVDVWTRGLEAFAGGDGGGGGEEEDEAAGGGLALSVGGVRGRDVTLFDGQAELLGHVWAGTCSTWCAAGRAASSRRHAGVARTQHGVTLRVASEDATSLALDAQVVVSLWSRSARGSLSLRAGRAARRAARLGAAWLDVRAEHAASSEPELRVHAQLDFYSDVAVCVRAYTTDHVYNRTVSLSSGDDATPRVRRSRDVVTSHAGRTLALGRTNDVTCRAYTPTDDDD